MSAVQALGRALLHLLIRLVYPRAPAPQAIETLAVRKVLVIRTDTRVGNVLLTTPLVRALRRGLPQARIDWLVAQGKECLVEGLADRILPFGKKAFFKAPLQFWRFVRELKAERYDVVIEAGHWHAFSFTSLWLARATGAAVRIGHQRGQSDRFLTHEVVHDPKAERDVEAKLELLQPLGLSPAGEELETTVDQSEGTRGQVEALLAGLVKPLAMNVGARKADHRWPPEAFGHLAARLAQELGATPLVLWGPGEEELAQQVVDASQGRARLAPPTDLAALAGVFRRSALVVTNDTGPMHLAVATGVPVVAVLLAQDGARWSHSGRFVGVPVGVGGRDEDVVKVAEAARKLLG
ncbi:MAG: glycosyltransferase family 9 protein [Myxococcales bacterium]